MLVEATGDAHARFAQCPLAAVPRAHPHGRRTVHVDLVLMLAERSPYLPLDGTIFEPALASQAVGCGRDRVLLWRDVEPFDDQEPFAREEAAGFRDRPGPNVIIKEGSERV